MTLLAVADHLWQSTLFLAAIALLTMLCRRNRAGIRYGLWLAASLKFLVPFAAVIALGSQLEWPAAAPPVEPSVAVTLDVLSEPFSQGVYVPASRNATAETPAAAPASTLPLVLLLVWMAGSAGVLFGCGIGWWRIRRVIRLGDAGETVPEADRLRHLHARLGLAIPVRLVVSAARLEPGIFGVTAPVLLWPRVLLGRLDAAEIDAIFLHELCHVRRRDNLAALVHMLVQVLFWFHPLVWWLGSRLVHERERACDEAVLRLGSEPSAYAEGLLKTCESCIESPLICVSGVTGSELKTRIESIMRNQAGDALGVWRKALLGGAGVLMVGLPIVLGVVRGTVVEAEVPPVPAADIRLASLDLTPPPAPPVMQAAAPSQAAPADTRPAFEVASVKPNRSGTTQIGLDLRPGNQVSLINVFAATLIQAAYQVRQPDLIGGPDWLRRDRFDVIAKPPDPAAPIDQLRLMVQRLLEDRFKLVMHKETRETRTYALVLAAADGTLGPNLRRAEVDCAAQAAARAGAPRQDAPPPNPLNLVDNPCGIRLGMAMGRLGGRGQRIAFIANMLGQASVLGTSIVDRTGLTGGFDFDLTWTPDRLAAASALAAERGVAPPSQDGPSLFTAVQEQLGLKLEPVTASVEVTVIDRLEQPTPD